MSVLHYTQIILYTSTNGDHLYARQTHPRIDGLAYFEL